MSEHDRFNRFLKQHPYDRHVFFERPHWTRRRFFEVAGAGVTGAFLAQPGVWAADGTGSKPAPKNTAKNVVFILLAGAPSHTDTFDFKMVNGVTPASFAPETINGVTWPTGLLPKLGQQLSDFAIVRSMRSHALVHGLSQTWTQIGRSPAATGSSIAPHIGSVVAIEKESERRPGQKFPTFLALNSNGAAGPGYFPAKYGAFKLAPDRPGLTNASSPAGPDRFNRRWDLLHSLDDSLRVNSPLGGALEDYGDFYGTARDVMDGFSEAASFTSAETIRYGSSALGNACLMAARVLRADQGTRFLQITSGEGWDMHSAIYSSSQLPAKGKTLDNAVSALLTDLKANGQFDNTLVVMFGEFGRTVGRLTGAQGRDHYAQQFAFFAGGGVKGGTIIGATNDSGADVADYGWSRGRYVFAEDVEATIYSALGIDWTTVRRDDPLRRGFAYTPFSSDDLYGPLHELWG